MSLDTQVDGEHYTKLSIQPVELAYMLANGDACFCKVAKYLIRDKDDYVLQLDKAMHITQLAKEVFSLKVAFEGTASQYKLLSLFAKQGKYPELIYEALESFLDGYYSTASRAMGQIKEKECLKQKQI